MRAALVAVIAFALLFAGGRADALRHPGAPRCPVFPQTNPWTQHYGTAFTKAATGTRLTCLSCHAGGRLSARQSALRDK